MRGSHGGDEEKGGEAGGRGREEELLTESGEYLHYKRTEVVLKVRVTPVD